VVEGGWSSDRVIDVEFHLDEAYKVGMKREKESVFVEYVRTAAHVSVREKLFVCVASETERRTRPFTHTHTPTLTHTHTHPHPPTYTTHPHPRIHTHTHTHTHTPTHTHPHPHTHNIHTHTHTHTHIRSSPFPPYTCSYVCLPSEHVLV
jgi:hypothetical protein